MPLLGYCEMVSVTGSRGGLSSGARPMESQSRLLFSVSNLSMLKGFIAILLLFGQPTRSFAIETALTIDASQLVESMSREQKQAGLFELKDAGRANWSNLPTFLAPTEGIKFSDFSDAQRRKVFRILQGTLSSQGYHKSSQIIWMDDLLKEVESKTIATGIGNVEMASLFVDSRGSGNYTFAIFGNPRQPDWGWKLAGHHLAINVTVSGGRIAVSPTFWGSNPRVDESGPYSGFAPLAKEHDLGLEFVRSLTEDQLEAATVLSEQPSDVFEGPGKRGSLAKLEGLSSANLSLEQLSALQHLTREFVGNGNRNAAGEHLDAIATNGWRKLWFAWHGPISGEAPFYYRIHGERVLIEYLLQDLNHDHAIVRDPANDYGEDWLGSHLTEQHPSQRQLMQKLELIRLGSQKE